jgi:dihydropteroate synthase
MLEDGADILDIGGESSRPGSDPVGAGEELERVIPVIEGIRQWSDIPISVDTRKALVAERALDAGADIINDISALRDDADITALAAERGCPVILMHMRGTPKTMQTEPVYRDVVAEVIQELESWAETASSRGVSRDRIILDPGIGFGKRLSDNLQLLRHIGKLRNTRYPVLVGLSRKSFIERLLHIPVEERLAASLAAEAYTVHQGAEIVRAHDVRETVHLVKMLAAIHTA